MQQRNNMAQVMEQLPDDRIERLREALPEIFSDGRLDADKLKQLCDQYGPDDERTPGYYGLYWPGKAEAKREAYRKPTDTLAPVEGDGVDEDTTHNIYIEGDNLKVLRILKRSYENRVNMIYIDPPYNTGSDFVYHDDYSMETEDYLKVSGQVDDAGKRLQTNPKSSGRYHTDWLSMITPRLMLAKDLLTDDGVIFISIDDNEQANLKLICDDVFGQENFVGQLIIETATDNNPSQIITQHEYMLCYARNKGIVKKWNRKSEAAEIIQKQYEMLKNKHSSTEKIQELLRSWIKNNKEKLPQVSHYNNVDEKGVYSNSGNSSNPHPGGYMYDIEHPITHLNCPKPSNGWRWPEETFKKYAAEGDIEWGKDHTTQPHVKKRLETVYEQLRSIIYEDNRLSTQNLENLFDGVKVFDNPKPTSILYKLIDYVTAENDIVIDFFAGSSSTAEALLQLNRVDGKCRKFIMVQLPENLDQSLESSKGEAKKQVTRTIKFLDTIGKKHTLCEIGKERIRRAGKKILEEHPEQKGKLDVGFRVYRHQTESNIVAYNQVSGTDEKALDNLLLSLEHQMQSVVPDCDLSTDTGRNRLFTEVLLRQGFALDSMTTVLDELPKNRVVMVNDPERPITLYICLDKKIEDATIENLVLQDTDKFICLNTAISDTAYARLCDHKGRVETI